MGNEPLYKKVGEEVINETISLGLGLLIIVLGVNYFNYKYAWVNVLKSLAEPVSGSTLYTEVTLMLTVLGNSFPFKYFFGDYNLLFGILIGVGFLSIGVVLKIITKTSKEKFIIDMGRNIYVPAIVGFVSVVLLQLIIAFNHQIGFTSELSNPFYIWFTYGELVVIGVTTLVLGAVVKLIARAQQTIKLKILANSLLYGSYISLGFYLLIRILSGLATIIDGEFLKLFILSGDVSVYVIIFCIFMYTFGLEIKRFGEYLAHKKTAELHFADLPDVKPPKHLI